MRKGLILLGILALLALSLPAAGGMLTGFWHLLFAPAFMLAF
jgi:hypothetical protein